jgi:hypothetical protein
LTYQSQVDSNWTPSFGVHSDYFTNAKEVLVCRENTSPELANEIARRLDGRPGYERRCAYGQTGFTTRAGKAIRLFMGWNLGV